MECSTCHLVYPSNMFVGFPLHPACDHISSCCLSCLSRLNQCPEHPNLILSQDIQDHINRSLQDQHVETNLQDETELNPTSSTSSASRVVILLDEPITIQVLTLGGDVYNISTNKKHSIMTLKEIIETQMSIPIGKQSLFYKNIEMENYNQGISWRVSDYGIQDKDKIYLSILMKEIDVGDNINHVTVRLQWNWVQARDFMDGAVYVLDNDNVIIARLDYDNNVSDQCGGDAIFHKGDDIESERKLGSQIISMTLENIPPHVSTIVFTLSSFKSETLSSFRNTRVHIHDDHTNQQVATCETGHVHTQAIIVCAFKRTNQQGWRIFQINRQSGGNVRNDSALRNSILDVVNNL